MSRGVLFTDLLGIQGWEAEPDGVYREGGAVIVKIRRRPGSGFRCGHCGEGLVFAYDTYESRRIRDYPIWGHPCYLEAKLVRVDCPNCGVVIESLEWVERWARHTVRYEKYVAHLCDLLPVTDVATLEGLNKNTVYRIDKKWLQRRHERMEDRPVRYLGIDEIALRKGHRYATVFYDLERREVIGVVRTRRERPVGGWFRRWGKKKCRAVEAVCMDVWAAYLNSVRRHCKNAQVVFDKFHVYRYLSVAIEQVRRREQSACAPDQARLIKGSRWLWLKSPGKLKRTQRHTLNEIMALNKGLQRAYLLKEDFEAFYECNDRAEAESFLKHWTRRCQRSGLEDFRKLARRLNRWKDGILAYFEHRITNGIAEGINNKIKVLKRRSYGFHDQHYFFLKILNSTGALPALQYVGHPLF